MKTKVGFLSYKKKNIDTGWELHKLSFQNIIQRNEKSTYQQPYCLWIIFQFGAEIGSCGDFVIISRIVRFWHFLFLKFFETCLIFDIVAFHFYFNDYLKRFRHKWHNILEKMWIFIKPGRRFGNPSVGKKMKKKAKKLTTTPIHHAPTHCGSEEVKSILIYKNLRLLAE